MFLPSAPALPDLLRISRILRLVVPSLFRGYTTDTIRPFSSRRRNGTTTLEQPLLTSECQTTPASLCCSRCLRHARMPRFTSKHWVRCGVIQPPLLPALACQFPAPSAPA